MSDMSRNSSASSFQGLATFSIFQPALGDALQWFPVLGSRELDDMINAFVLGPFSIQDKRAHVAMDFCQYAQQTGENFKIYSVYNYTPSLSSFTTDSPASSSAMYDSGYGSSFNMSPVVWDNMAPYTPSVPAAATPSSTASDLGAKPRPSASSSAAKKPAPSGSRSGSRLDFSNHPGMRILTKDGRDVTDSAARGSKTKEQRDHAHLMRVIKACESCRKKKTRCDPSHKKRSASQSQPSLSGAQSAKKLKTTSVSYEPQPQAVGSANNNNNAPVGSALVETPAIPHHGLSETPDDFWLQFVNLDGAVPTPEEYSSGDNSGWFSSNTVTTSATPSQLGAPFTPASAVPSGGLTQLPEEPRLPYLHPDGDLGTNYLDFNLYSPVSDFLDEEPQLPKKSRVRAGGLQQPGAPAEQPRQRTELSLFDNDPHHYAGQADSDGPLLRPDLSNWALLHTNGSGSQLPASQVYDSQDRSSPNSGPAGVPLPPRPPQPPHASHGVDINADRSAAHGLGHSSSPIYETLVSPSSLQETQTMSLQQPTRSSIHRGRLATPTHATVVSPLLPPAVSASAVTHGWSDGEVPVGVSRLAPRTDPAASDVFSPVPAVAMTALGFSSYHSRPSSDVSTPSRLHADVPVRPPTGPDTDPRPLTVTPDVLLASISQLQTDSDEAIESPAGGRQRRDGASILAAMTCDIGPSRNLVASVHSSVRFQSTASAVLDTSTVSGMAAPGLPGGYLPTEIHDRRVGDAEPVIYRANHLVASVDGWSAAIVRNTSIKRHVLVQETGSTTLPLLTPISRAVQDTTSTREAQMATDSSKGWPMVAFGLVSCVLLSSCMRLASSSSIGVLDLMLLLSLGVYLQSSRYQDDRCVDISTVSRVTDDQLCLSSQSVKAVIAVKSKIQTLSRHTDGLRCANVRPMKMLERAVKRLPAMSLKV